MKNYPIVLYVSKCRALVALERRRYLAKTIAIGYKGLTYSLVMLMVFLGGLSPVLFNYVVDPYNVNNFFDLGMNKEKISLKAHYPLWKISNYPKDTATTLILGDSRALALKDKYWHQLKVDEAYNFAYGGATIHEIIDTVEYLKDSPEVNTLIIGIQLRSFSPLFKKGLNRVPEAIELVNDPVQYYANNFVTDVSWQQVEKRYAPQIKQFKNIAANLDFSLISTAHAKTIVDKDAKNLETLLDPANCTGCILPKLTTSQPGPIVRVIKQRHAFGLGGWSPLWPQISMNRQLPLIFSNQVTKNAQSDWQSFSFSQQYWRGLVDIAHWSKRQNINLIFFIPPTIVEMQQQITNYGYAEDNQALRMDLARLAPVVDFDFDSPLTRSIDNFNDAYHFNYKVAKMVIGELIQFIDTTPEAKALALKRREQITCPITQSELVKELTNDNVNMREGNSCRIWRGRHE